MSTRSNSHNLPDGYIEALVAQYPDQLVDAYLDGKFVNLTSGSVYYAFDRVLNNTHYVVKPREAVHIGMDFNVYKMAAIIHIQRDGHLFAVDEFIDLRDTADMILSIKEKYQSEGHPVVIYPDSSGKNASSKGASQSDIKMLKEAGFRVRYKNANPRIKDRVLSMNTALEKKRYFVNVAKCPLYTESLEQQIYDKSGKPDKEGDLDHPVDAGGYCCYYIMPVIRQVVTDRVLGGL